MRSTLNFTLLLRGWIETCFPVLDRCCSWLAATCAGAHLFTLKVTLTCGLAIHVGQAARKEKARKVGETAVVKERPCQKCICVSLALDLNHKTQTQKKPTSKSGCRGLTQWFWSWWCMALICGWKVGAQIECRTKKRKRNREGQRLRTHSCPF